MAKSFNYKKAMKSMRGKVGFDYDLRRKLTPGQKAAIRRNYNDYAQYKNQQFIKPPKRGGESDRQYNRRIRELKEQFGQEDMGFQGVWINTPKKLHYRIYDNRIHTYGKNGGGRTVSETHYPISGKELIADPEGVAADIFRRFSPFRALWFSYHGYRGHDTIEDTDDFEIFAETFESFLDALAARYKSSSPIEHITGVIIQH